jgi:tRNA(Arg) A34 adenosine deaminase TadA
MSDQDKVNRRDFIVTTAGMAGAATALASGTSAQAQAQTQALPPQGFEAHETLRRNWAQPLQNVVDLNLNPDFAKDTEALQQEGVKERHRIYCYLLMKLIHRFWNGNKKGPLGTYPLRVEQKDVAQTPQRYRGDMLDKPDGIRVNWDRYLGHNIACIAVDGNGEIMDFDFNHNDFFRSTSEHAESRMVRRLFSLTDIFDSWRTGQRTDDDRRRSRGAMLNEVTLYTSLESCAQCSGVMSLAGVKQIIYLQSDFSAYMVGNIMYNLADRSPLRNRQGVVTGTRPTAPIPIRGSLVGIEEFDRLNATNLDFIKNMRAAGAANPPDLNGAFFVPDGGGRPDFEPSITSFLCTDVARNIFRDGAKKLDNDVGLPDFRFPSDGSAKENEKVLTNRQCLQEARDFFDYADIEGYRGSPHKL